MDAKELRIGNLVYNGKKEVIQVSLDIIGYLINNGDKDACNIKPIPLTEDWFLKFWFRKSITNTCFGIITNDGKLRLSIFTDGLFKIETSDLPYKVQYVHQLQNLYFALTGEELPLKY